MLSTESTFFRKIVSLAILTVILGVSIAFVFRPEINDAIVDRFALSENAAAHKWSKGVGGKVTLRPESNDSAFVRVANLRSGTPSRFGVPVSFDLINLGAMNDYPDIGVVMMGMRGPTRETVYSPQQYAHGKKFEQERIELFLNPKPEETSFTVRAFYQERP